MTSFEAIHFDAIRLRPRAATIELLLTATTAISHHDAAVADKSNRQLFNRQAQLVTGVPEGALPDQATIDRLAAAFPVPADLAGQFAFLTFPEFVAVALVRLFLDIYNHGDGAGIFSGMDRYPRLEDRARQAAVAGATLRGWWDDLRAALQTPTPPADSDFAVMTLLLVPPGLQQLVLRVLADSTGTAVTLARLWHDAQKRQAPAYAAKAAEGRRPASQISLFAPAPEAYAPERVPLRFAAADMTLAGADVMKMELPALSGNAVRHQVVREPVWTHLRSFLGIAAGDVPPPVEAIFYNGGNIRAGAKGPANGWDLTQQMRRLYPSLDLVGGVTNADVLGQSQVDVSAHLVCRQNAAALAETIAEGRPLARVDATTMLDDVTLTRHADGGDKDAGQMLFSFETLCAGVEILVQLTLRPFTSSLTAGALLAAVNTFRELREGVGGGGARGFGNVRVLEQRSAVPDHLPDYEVYLMEHRDRLRAGLLDGTFGTGAVVVS